MKGNTDVNNIFIKKFDDNEFAFAISCKFLKDEIDAFFKVHHTFLLFQNFKKLKFIPSLCSLYRKIKILDFVLQNYLISFSFSVSTLGSSITHLQTLAI